jgi:hypothetical protein
MSHYELFDTIEETLSKAEARSSLEGFTEQEGLVFKCYEYPSISFKAISNQFLLKNGG